MPKGIVKYALFGGAMVVAATAIGYTQGAAFKTPNTSTVAVAAPADKALEVAPQAVAAFVTSTRLMGEPAVATLADLRDTETLIVAQGTGPLAPTAKIGGAVYDTDFDALLNGLGVDEVDVVDNVAVPPSRPTEIAQVGDAIPATAIEKQQSRTRSGSTKPRPVKIKRRVWSTGEYR